MRKNLFTALLPLLLVSCTAVGPNYRAPTTEELHVPARWNAQTAKSGATSSSADLAAWWRQLEDPLLSAFIEQALRDSPNVRLAQARLREARARRDLASANRFPTVIASASGSRTRSSRETGSGGTHSLYDAGFDASWEPDVFGGVRRGLEAAEGDLAASQSDLHATQVSLAAEIALNYVEVRSFQARIGIAQANLATQSETLQLTQWRAEAGLTSVLDVEQARTNVEQTRAQIPTLESSLAEAQHRLAILLGMAPGALTPSLKPPGSIPAVPLQLDIGIPADTLRQRPDLRAAERRLAAETARIGQQTAARYPNFSLNGSLGVQALTVGALTSGAAITHQIAAGIAATVVDAGRIRQQIEIQSAIQEQALRSYESAVLTALEDVENALVALATTTQRGTALASAVAS
ncbi:MAG TPA: efflux transporter outer membrane subunit, partial [Burkholderiales bacterium]|nr:efflux transporter outer membrane subunit [Burkholderiales bacterium]